MSIRAVDWCFKNARVDNAAALATLLVVANFANDDGAGAWPSIPTIAKLSRNSERSVHRHLRQLVAAGVLRIEPPQGRRRSNTYRLNMVHPCHSVRGDTVTGVSDHSDHGSTLPPCQVIPGEVAGASLTDCQVTDDTMSPDPSGTVRSSVTEKRAAASPLPHTSEIEAASDPARRPSDSGNYRVLLRLAHEQLEADPSLSSGALVDVVKDRAAQLTVDRGEHPDVDRDVVQRACASAEVQRKLFAGDRVAVAR